MCVIFVDLCYIIPPKVVLLYAQQRNMRGTVSYSIPPKVVLLCGAA